MSIVQPPTRLSDPAASPATQQVHADIYDKLNRLLVSGATPASTPVTPSTTPTRVTLVSIAGASGTAAGPQYAFVPKLLALPSVNPTGGSPYAQDGLLIEVNSQFWRYSRADLEWQAAGTATTILTDTHANRVLNYLPADYPNALFLESDTLLLLESNSLIWRTLTGEVMDTHVNRLTSWPSVQFSVNTFFVEADRTSRYWTQNAVGTVTVTGGVNVAWVSGHHFINTGSGFNAAQWPAGTPIVIAGVVCHVAVVISPISLTLQLATTNAAGVAYSVADGRWVYVDGKYTDVYTNLPTDLGENDYTAANQGFQFFDTTHWRLFQWAAAGSAPTSASPGWNRGYGEVPKGAVSLLPFGGSTAGWGLCDGSALVITLDDATTASVTTPNFVGAYAKGGVYSGAVVAKTTTTINPITPAGSVSLTGSSPVGAGIGGSVPTGASFSGTPVTPTVNVEGEEAHILIPFYMKR